MSVPSPAPTFWGCGRSLCQAQAGALLSPGGTQLLRGLISTRHFVWRNPVLPRGQKYALYKVFINFNREGTFPHTQKSLLIRQCHLSSSWSQPDPASHREGRAGQTDLHTPAPRAVAHRVPPQPILRGMKGSGWAHQLPTYGTGIPPTHRALSHEERQPKGIPLLPISGAVGALLSHPRRVCSSQPRTGTVGDRRGDVLPTWSTG